MATYSYACDHCETMTETEAPIGTATRTLKCECGKVAKLTMGRGLHIAAAATPNKKQGVRRIDAAEKRWETDMPAYKRMRRKGLQPPTIDGSAVLERGVDDQAHINYAKAFAASDSEARVHETIESLAPMAAK